MDAHSFQTPGVSASKPRDHLGVAVAFRPTCRTLIVDVYINVRYIFESWKVARASYENTRVTIEMATKEYLTT